MRILVIGGTRFIGATLVSELISDGNEVTIFHRGRTEFGRQEIRHIHGDRQELAKFTEEFKKLSPDIVVDMGFMARIRRKKS
jgi:nucleoside-diphosphate-sugar epimerase